MSAAKSDDAVAHGEEQAAEAEGGVQEAADDDAGSAAEEEYEIEAIMSANRGKRGWEYLVSWVGYGPEHNSWVVESDFGSHDLIDEYWSSKGGKPGKIKPGRPSKASQTPVTSSTRKRRGVSSIEALSDVEPDKATSKRAKRNHSAAATDQQAEGIEEGLDATYTDSMAPYADLANWEDKVKEIVTIERARNTRLVVYMIMVGGEKTAQDTETVYKRCPQKMLHFYENHLKWRNTGS